MATDKTYQELRDLILGPEKKELDQIRGEITKTPEERTKEVSEVLSDSIKMSSEKDDSLAVSMRPLVEKTIQESIKRDPKFFADVLFPIMGPAIRKAIASALKGVVDSINQSMENNFSKKALGWRVQSLTTGRSYGEIVLKNTLLFRVDQVFLIQQDSGLLMQYVSHPDWVSQADKNDSDAISAMLSAIQDFMYDSFNVDESDNLDSIDMGDSTVLLSHGPKATLACKVQGIPPKDLKLSMQNIIESIHLNYYKEMDGFSGDRDELLLLEPELQSLLLKGKKADELTEDSDVKKKKSFPLFLSLFGLALIAALAYSFIQHQQNKKLQNLALVLDEQPGIVVASAAKQNGKRTIKGLYDPLSDFAKIVDENPQDNLHYEFEAYQSLDSTIIAKRAAKALNTPESVNVSHENGSLVFTGEINNLDDFPWLEKVNSEKTYLAYATSIDTSKVKLNLSKEEFVNKHKALFIDINSTEFEFANSDVLIPEQKEKLIPLIKKIKLLDEYLEATPWSISLKITGISDASGTAQKNKNIRLKRARKIKELILDNSNTIEPDCITLVAFSGSDDERRLAKVAVSLK